MLSRGMRCWDREVTNPEHNVGKQPHSCSQQHAPTGEEVAGTEKSSFSYSWFCHAGDVCLCLEGTLLQLARLGCSPQRGARVDGCQQVEGGILQSRATFWCLPYFREVYDKVLKTLENPG